MDAIKEAMIAEEDTGELDKRLDLYRVDRKISGVCAYPNCTCTPVGMWLCRSEGKVSWWKRMAMQLRFRESPLR